MAPPPTALAGATRGIAQQAIWSVDRDRREAQRQGRRPSLGEVEPWRSEADVLEPVLQSMMDPLRTSLATLQEMQDRGGHRRDPPWAFWDMSRHADTLLGFAQEILHTA